jgi:hypothetical protein
MGKRPANAKGMSPVRPAFTGMERNAMLEAFGALWLAVREWWASWFELTPRARKVLRRTLFVAWLVWALIAPFTAGYFVGAYVLPVWLIVRVWRLWRAAKRKRAARVERKRTRVREPRVITITFGRQG